MYEEKKKRGVQAQWKTIQFFLKEGNSTIYDDKEEPNEPYAKNSASNT